MLKWRICDYADTDCRHADIERSWPLEMNWINSQIIKIYFLVKFAYGKVAAQLWMLMTLFRSRFDERSILTKKIIYFSIKFPHLAILLCLLRLISHTQKFWKTVPQNFLYNHRSVGGAVHLCTDPRHTPKRFNSFMMEVRVIQKPVHWFALCDKDLHHERVKYVV